MSISKKILISLNSPFNRCLTISLPNQSACFLPQHALLHLTVCANRIRQLPTAVYPWTNKSEPSWRKIFADKWERQGETEFMTKKNRDLMQQIRRDSMQQMEAETRQRLLMSLDDASPDQCQTNNSNNQNRVLNRRTRWIPNVTQRCGLLGIKLGVLPAWTDRGIKTLNTVYQILDNVVLDYIPPAQFDAEQFFGSSKGVRAYMRYKHDFPTWATQKRWGVQTVAAMRLWDPGALENNHENSSRMQLFLRAGVEPRRFVSRFLVSEDAALQPCTELTVQHFRIGQRIDVLARTRNRGFQGVIERHGMEGGPAAHGSTKFHRKMGSAAGGGRPILRGKRMPGVMGNRFRAHRGATISRIDLRHQLIYVSSPTPGPNNSLAHIFDSWLTNHRRAYAHLQEVNENTQENEQEPQQQQLEEDEASWLSWMMERQTPPVPTIYPGDPDWMDETTHPDEYQSDLFIEKIHRMECDFESVFRARLAAVSDKNKKKM